MAQVTKVVYHAGGLDRTLPSPAEDAQIWDLLKGQFPELANGTYSVANGVMTASLRTGSKASH